MAYILDIETRGDKRLIETYLDGITAPKTYKDEDKIALYLEEKRAEAQQAMAVDPDFNEIICIGIKELNKPGQLMTLVEYAEWLISPGEDTKDGLKGALHLFDKMITFNGKHFDLPTILRCGLRNKVDLPYRELLEQCDKYKAKNHLDLMQELSVDWGKFKSLDKYLQIYLGISKKPIDFSTASDEEIRAHCLEDLDNTEKLFAVFRPLFVWRNPKPTAGLDKDVIV